MPPHWSPESVGWFDGPRLVGAGLVLYRRVPLLGSLAYVGEGPVVDWAAWEIDDVTTPLLGFLRERGAFSVKLAPDLVLRRWQVDTLRSALREGRAKRLRDVPPDAVDETAAAVAQALQDQGWRQYEAPAPGFGGQMHPRYRSQVPLAEGIDPERRLDAQWRRNLRKSRSSGIAVGPAQAADLPVFYGMYLETAARDGFPALPEEFFERLWESLTSEDAGRIELYLASREGEAHAAALQTRVGDAVAYIYGASTTVGRGWRPSNALQWRMLCDAAASGAAGYDLRGISDTLEPTDPLFGLLRFKLGLGGDAIEMVGEWDYALRPIRHRVVADYLGRRSR
jgi:lipid II:glycine glycyltransferase (peptidoglycan interpeptide bridge formation enzyme)